MGRCFLSHHLSNHSFSLKFLLTFLLLPQSSPNGPAALRSGIVDDKRFWDDHVCHRLRFVQAGAATWRRCSSEGVHWFGATLTGRIASRGAAAQADVDPNQRNPLIRSFGFCAAHFWLNSFSCFFLVLRERFVIVDENRRCGV